MVYRTVAELLEAKKDVLLRLDHRVSGLDAAQLGQRALTGGWSIQEIVEHLAIVETQLIRLVSTLHAKAEAAGVHAAPRSPSTVSAESILEMAAGTKYVTREKFEPTGTVPASSSLQTLRSIQDQLLDLRPRLESVNLAHASFPHWLFGPLDLGQWLTFFGAHEERHLAQIEAILGPSDPGSKEKP